MAHVNTRPHRSTQEPPVIRLAEEHERLHRLPRFPHTVCFGETRKVSWQSTISVGGAIYSVPHGLIDERVWARTDGSELIVVHADRPRAAGGRASPADHPGPPGDLRPALPAPAGGRAGAQAERSQREEQAFLQIGPAAERWLIKAAAAGAARVRRKMAEAVDLAKLHGAERGRARAGACADAGPVRRW